jgi:hypothetical protein
LCIASHFPPPRNALVSHNPKTKKKEKKRKKKKKKKEKKPASQLWNEPTKCSNSPAFIMEYWYKFAQTERGAGQKEKKTQEMQKKKPIYLQDGFEPVALCSSFRHFGPSTSSKGEIFERFY